MSQRVGRKLRWLAQGIILFECPGCDMEHMVHVERQSDNGPLWQWNGSGDAPIIHPSILVTYDHMSEAGRKRSQEFYEKHGRYPDHTENPYDTHDVCHSFVGCNGAEPGQIKFLSDSTHHLAGQTVDLPDMED